MHQLISTLKKKKAQAGTELPSPKILASEEKAITITKERDAGIGYDEANYGSDVSEVD